MGVYMLINVLKTCTSTEIESRAGRKNENRHKEKLSRGNFL